MSKKKKIEESVGFQKVVEVILEFICLFFLKGLCEFRFKDIKKWIIGFLVIVLIADVTIYFGLMPLTSSKVGDFIWIVSILSFLTLFTYGLRTNGKNLKFQKGLDLMGLKNVKDSPPKVTKVIKLDEHRTKILVTAKGIGLEEFKSKKEKLESALQQSVEDFSYTKNKKFVSISLCTRELPSMIKYSELGDHKLNPYSFFIGESMAGGIVDCEIRELPHLLIGGTTGGGKSSFFKGTLLNLLKSSPHIQMYLIDLKRGVEVKEFAELPNVEIAKDEPSAVKMLTVIKEEMERRYEYLEKAGTKKIDPIKDKMDLIVVGIDEASVLYGKTNANSLKKELVAEARDLTDELAKLARASGIHLIIATQKPIKESIDTKTLENLPGRLSFKMSTHAGSNSMLGNGKAYSLPDVKGRAIWKDGNKFLEVQTPFVSDDDIEQELLELKAQYEKRKTLTFREMLPVHSLDADDKDVADKLMKDAQ